MTARLEPKEFNSADLHEKCLEIFENKQWISFFEKFNGHHEQVSMAFAETFNGEIARVGNLQIRLSEDVLAQVTGLPQQGERFFKTKQFKEKVWIPFLCRSRAGSVNWKKGIPRSWLIHPWDEIVYIIQKFVTCEGRFSIIYLYHIKLLQHLKGECEVNIPYFLLQSLTKMAKAVQGRSKDKVTSLFHCGLIKMIIQYELHRQNLTWTEFLAHNQFENQEELLEENAKEDEILMLTYPEATSSKLPQGRKKKKEIVLITDEEDNSEATRPKPPQRRIQTRSLKKKEKQYQKQDQLFTTYQRKSRKYKQVQSQSAFEDEEQVQTLGSPGEDLTVETVQDISNPDEVIRQTKKINLFFDQQEKDKHSKQELPKDSNSLFSEQQAMEEEKEHEEFGEDATSEQPLLKKKKKKTSKNSKKIQRLKHELKELGQQNEKLRETNWKLKVQRTRITKQACRRYKQKKVYKAKYERMRILYASRASTDASSQTED